MGHMDAAHRKGINYPVFLKHTKTLFLTILYITP
jgi:hypothetical protein